jgi:LysM repeat protein
MKGDSKMQTLFHHFSHKRLQRAGRLALFAFLALAMVAAAFPQTASAASKCATYYTVKSGDTASQIAHTYSLRWADIAKANNMKNDARLKVGQSLCIPAKNPPKGVQTGTMKAGSNGDALNVKMSGFPERSIWYVNVSDAQNRVPGVFKVGQMTVPVNTDVTGWFKLPPELRKTPYLMVCVKNAIKMQKICHQVYHKV